MEKHQQVGLQIAEFLTAPTQQMWELLTQYGSRFVVCGTSGSGKTRAIDWANELLLKDAGGKQVAESQELLSVDCPNKALDIIRDPDLAYEDSWYIGFNVVRADLARSLADSGVKVFWLDGGSSFRAHDATFAED